MKHSKWLALALTIGLLLPAAAEPDDPKVILRRLTQMVQRQQYDQVVDLVVANPARAESLFRAALQQGASHPQWLNSQKVALNSLATIFEKRLGRPEFSQQLQSLGLRTADAPLSNYLQGVAASGQDLGPLDLSLRAGNYRTALRLLDQLQRQESLFGVLRVVALESSGQVHRALGEAQGLVQRLTPQDPQRSYALMTLVAAARACQRPELVKAHLPGLLQTSQAEAGDSARLACFTLESWNRPAGESVTRQNLVQAHRRAWERFPTQPLKGLKPGEARWACAAARDWISDLVGQARALDPKSPEYAELLKLIESDLQSLSRQIQPDSRGSRDLQIEFIFGTFDASLDCVEALISARLIGDFSTRGMRGDWAA